MDIHYEIQTITNAEGEGTERQYVKVKQLPPITEKKLLESIEHGCTLTASDLKAAFTALHDHVVSELQSGRRCHIPGLGYFALSVEADKDALQPGKKLRGTDIRVRTIRFQPEQSLVNEVAAGTHFVRSQETSKSVAYTEQTLWPKISDYLDAKHYITTRLMRSEFGLKTYSALKWLTYFTDKGLLKKEGLRNSHIYLKRETAEGN